MYVFIFGFDIVDTPLIKSCCDWVFANCPFSHLPAYSSQTPLPSSLNPTHLQWQVNASLLNLTQLQYPTGLKRTTVQACPGCENAQSSLRSYCVRPRRPAGPAPSRPAEPGGGARRSCNTAASAAGSLGGSRRPQPETRIQPCLHPPSRSAAAQPTGDPGRLRGARRGLCPPAVVRCLHARIRARRSTGWSGCAFPTPALNNGVTSPKDRCLET